MAEGGEGNRREIQGRLVEGEPVEGIVEAGADPPTVEQERPGGQQTVEDGGITPQKMKCYYFFSCLLVFISSLSAIGNIYLLYSRGKETPVGAVGLFVSACFLSGSGYACTFFNAHKADKRARNVVPGVDPLLLALVRTEAPRVVFHSRQEPAIDAGNASATSPAHPADPAVAGPSGLQPPAPHAPDEHSYRTLRSGRKIPLSESRHSERQSVLQAPVSRESSATRSISEVALSLSQITAARIGGRKRTLPNRKASIHEESISEDSDDSALG